MERLNLSLDQMIGQQQQQGGGGGKSRGGQGGRGGKARTVSSHQRVRQQSQPYRIIQTHANDDHMTQPHLPLQHAAVMGGGHTKPSILTRLGGGNHPSSSGTTVIFSSLNKDIRASDIAELCGTVGETRKVELQSDARGKALLLLL